MKTVLLVCVLVLVPSVACTERVVGAETEMCREKVQSQILGLLRSRSSLPQGSLHMLWSHRVPEKHALLRVADLQPLDSHVLLGQRGVDGRTRCCGTNNYNPSTHKCCWNAYPQYVTSESLEHVQTKGVFTLRDARSLFI